MSVLKLDVFSSQFCGSLVLGLIILFIFATIKRNRRPKGFPRGPLSLPFIGNLHQLGTHPFKKFMVLKKKYGDVFAVDFASFSGIVINSNELIREAFAMPEFSGRPALRPFLERYGGEMRGIIVNVGQSWTEHRRFTLKNLRDFGFGKNSMETLIQNEVDEVLEMYANANGKPFHGKHLFNLISLNTLWMLITGERFSYDDKRLTEISNIFADGLSESPAAGAFFFFPTLSRIAPNLTGYNSFMSTQFATFDLIKQKYIEEKASFKNGTTRHFMDVYIQQVMGTKDSSSAFYGDLGEEHIIGSISDLFMAGIETTGTTMSWAFLLLMLHPRVQDKMYNEIKSVVGLSATPALSDKARLPYMEAVLTEILRYSTLFPLGVFHAATEDVEFHGHKIPKGTMVVANQYGVHHDPEIWGDPECFRPERFMTSDGKVLPTRNENILSFSCGKRLCIGELMARHTLFLFFARVISQFKIEPNPAKPTPQIDYVPTLVLQTKPYEYVMRKRQ